MFLIQHLCELIFLTEDFHWFKNVVMNTVCEKDMNIGCFLFLAKVCVEGGGGGWGWGGGEELCITNRLCLKL